MLIGLIAVVKEMEEWYKEAGLVIVNLIGHLILLDTLQNNAQINN